MAVSATGEGDSKTIQPSSSSSDHSVTAEKSEKAVPKEGQQPSASTTYFTIIDPVRDLEHALSGEKKEVTSSPENKGEEKTPPQTAILTKDNTLVLMRGDQRATVQFPEWLEVKIEDVPDKGVRITVKDKQGVSFPDMLVTPVIDAASRTFGSLEYTPLPEFEIEALTKSDINGVRYVKKVDGEFRLFASSNLTQVAQQARVGILSMEAGSKEVQPIELLPGKTVYAKGPNREGQFLIHSRGSTMLWDPKKKEFELGPEWFQGTSEPPRIIEMDLESGGLVVESPTRYGSSIYDIQIDYDQSVYIAERGCYKAIQRR